MIDDARSGTRRPFAARPRTFALLTLVAGMGACSHNDVPVPTIRPPTAEQIPQSVPIAGGVVTTGVKLGRMRGERTLSAYALAKYPITVSQYRACEAAGACSAPSTETCVETSGLSVESRGA